MPEITAKLHFNENILTFNNTPVKCTYKSPEIIWSDNTEYTRNSSSTASLSMNKSLPAGYNIFVFKFDAKWSPGNQSIYDFRVEYVANNKTFYQRLCQPTTKTYVPVLYCRNGNNSIEKWGGSYNTNVELEYKTQTNDCYLARKISNNTYYTNKVIYNNIDHTIKYYMPNNGGYIWMASNVSNFTQFTSINFTGNTTYPATFYIRNRSVYVCNTMEDALAY